MLTSGQHHHINEHSADSNVLQNICAGLHIIPFLISSYSLVQSDEGFIGETFKYSFPCLRGGKVALHCIKINTNAFKKSVLRQQIHYFNVDFNTIVMHFIVG